MPDMRAYLKPKPDSQEAVRRVLGDPAEISNLMAPLYSTGGLLFPYTPTIQQFGGSANYENMHFTHSNYKLPVYKNSEVRDIMLSAVFTAQTDFEATYVLAMMKMLSNVTKMTFGQKDSKDYNPDGDKSAGLPPPVLLFNYMGTHMYNDTPVVVSSYGIDLPNDVDYVPVKVKGQEDEISYVPTELTLNLELLPWYNPRAVTQNFKLSDFASGEMIRGKDYKDGIGKGYL